MRRNIDEFFETLCNPRYLLWMVAGSLFVTYLIVLWHTHKMQ